MKGFVLSPQVKQSLIVAFVFQFSWVLAAMIGVALNYAVDVQLILVIIPLLWLPALMGAMTGVAIPVALQAHFYFFITASSIAGSAFGLYGEFYSWDTVVHFDSGIMLAWLGFFVVRAAESENEATISGWLAALVVLMTPLAFAALWEISEYLSDMYLGTATQAGLTDTIEDMMAAAVGAVVAIIFARWVVPRGLLPQSYSSGPSTR